MANILSGFIGICFRLYRIEQGQAWVPISKTWSIKLHQRRFSMRLARGNLSLPLSFGPGFMTEDF